MEFFIKQSEINNFKEKLNSSFENVVIPSIKCYSIPKYQCLSVAKNKIKKSN